MVHRIFILRSFSCGGQGLIKVIPVTSKNSCWIFGSFLLFLLVLGIIGCSPKAAVKPPITPVLSRPALGYGVIAVSYTRVMSEPGANGVTLGFVREKTIVTVLERRIIKEGEVQEYWVLIEGNYRGWLPEPVMKLYDNKEKAQTAALQ